MILNLIRVLRMGHELRDPAKWKRGQWLTNAVGILVGAIFELLLWKYPSITFPADLQLHVTEGIAAVLAIMNLYLIPATTRKIGIEELTP